jgi:hypothetical protein
MSEIIWRKSIRSGPWTDNCVEVGFAGADDIRVRDTKNREAGELKFTQSEWTAFIAGAKDGEFDLV